MAKRSDPLSFNDLIGGLKSAKMEGMSSSITEQLKAHMETQQLAEDDIILSKERNKTLDKIEADNAIVADLLVDGFADANKNLIKLYAEVQKIGKTINEWSAGKSTGKKEDLSETDIENNKLQNDQTNLLIKIEENTRATDKPQAAPEAKESGGGLFSSIGKGIKSLGSGMSGTAKNLLAFSAALWITAKALQQFAKVEWESIAKGGVAIAGLAAAARLAGSGDAYKSILALGVGVLALAYGLNKFADVKWEGILKGSIAMFALAKAAQVAGSGDAWKSILALGVGTIALAYGLDKFADVSWGDVLTGTVAMFALAKAAQVADSGDAAKTILALGAGTLALAYGLHKFSEVSWGDVLTGTVAMFALAKAAQIAGSGDAWKSILAISAGTLMLAFGLKKFEEVSWESILKGVGVITALGLAVKLAGDGPGALAFLALGASIWAISKAFENFAALSWGDLMKGVVVIGLLGAGMVLLGTMGPIVMLGAAALLVMAGAVWILSKAFENIAESMDAFTSGIERLAAIGGAGLISVAAGIVALGAAMMVFGAAQMVAAIENLVSKFLSLGDDTPVEQLIKIGEAGPGIEKAATGLERLAAAMKAFADIDEDALDAAVEAAEDIAEAFEDNAITINVGSGSAPAAAVTPTPTPTAATPVKKAPMTNAAPTVTTTTESTSGTLSGVTGDQIRNHPNYKKYYDEAMNDYNDPVTARQEAADQVKADMVKEQNKVTPGQVTPAPAKANNVYGKSAEVAEGDKKQPAQKTSTVISAPTQVNNNTQNTSIKAPIRNQDNSIMGYIKSRFVS